MKNNLFKKIIGNSICAGILLTILPISAKTEVKIKELPKQISISKIETEKNIKLSKKEINQKIEVIRKTIKGFKILKFVLNSLAVGSVAVIGLGIGTAFLATIISTIPAAMSFGITASFNIYAFAAIGGLTTASVAAIIGGFVSAPQVLDLFGGLSSKLVIEAILGVKQLNNIEKKYPGTLTEKQKNTIAQFKNMTHGSILKGVVKGIKIQMAIRKNILEAIEDHPVLIAKFLGKPQAMNKIENYIKLKIKQQNTENLVSEHKNKIKKQKIIVKNTKNIAKQLIEKTKLSQQRFNLTYLFLKKSLKKLNTKIENFNKTYPELENKLRKTVKSTTKDISKILEEFKSPIKK